MVTQPKPDVAALVARSIDVIRRNQAESGAYVASPNFRVYRYSWLRDGAFIADAMSRSGHSDSAAAFLEWCRRIMQTREDAIAALVRRRAAGETIDHSEFLHTRFMLDGGDAGEEWWNHQLDGYGAWLWALGAHSQRTGAQMRREGFSGAVETTARYLLTFWDHPCYDCWEENPDRVHVATLAAVHAGLRVATDWPGVASDVRLEAKSALGVIEARVRSEGVRDGHLVKWLRGGGLDASLLFCAVPYGLFAADDVLMRSTVNALSGQLAHGGVHRHPADTYFGGGEWLLLAAVLGSWFVAVGETASARTQLDWVAAQADAGGHLPEQVSDHLLHPAALQMWVERWGPVASPLLWSHATFLNLYRDLAEQ